MASACAIHPVLEPQGFICNQGWEASLTIASTGLSLNSDCASCSAVPCREAIHAG